MGDSAQLDNHTSKSPGEQGEAGEKTVKQAGRRATEAWLQTLEVQGAVGGRRGRGRNDFLAWDNCWAWACMITETGWDNEVSVGTQDPLKQTRDLGPPCSGIRLQCGLEKEAGLCLCSYEGGWSHGAWWLHRLSEVSSSADQTQDLKCQGSFQVHTTCTLP